MTRIYQPLLLADGTPNPKYKPRAGRPSGPPRASLFERGEFIAWDGEGVTDARSKRHRYVMLMNSVQQSTTVNINGIPTRDCLDALCTVGEANPRAIHVVFGGSYDVNMMLGDCSYEQIQSVWSGEWTKVCNGRYSVNYRARKSFSIRRTIQRTERAKGSSIVLWDVFGFFQSTFVDAMLKYLGASDDLNTIKDRKAQRSTFRIKQLPEIQAYCAMECRALVALMIQLRDYLKTADLPISRWDGAGACAASLLRREKIIEHKRHRRDTPHQVLAAAQRAYAGGRTELVRYGHAPKTRIFHYDINSAYPHAMRSCPSLAHGQWKHAGANVKPRVPFALCRIEWNFNDAPMYPFFWRSHDTSIYYPQRGRGWCWLPEIDAANDAMQNGIIRGNISILESWSWYPTANKRIQPFGFIDPIFEQRAQWKRDGIGAEKVLKLAVNSLYGKTAQHVGGTKDEPPRYHQLEWSGFITSTTRAMVYRACALSYRKGKRWPRIVMVATDGVYSLDALALDTGSALGQWEETPHTGITVAQSGVYWTDDGRKEKMFCRGFDKGSLDRKRIISSWRKLSHEYDASLTRFVTMGTGLASREAFDQRWRQWRTCPRRLKLSPDGTKRFTLDHWTRANNPARAMMMTAAAVPASQLVGQLDSAAYPLPWDDAATRVAMEMLDGASARIVEQEAYDTEV